MHDFLLHFGTDKVLEFAKQYFMILNIERVVRDVVASCEICQMTKYYTRPTRGTEYFELPNEPGKVVSIDLYGSLAQTPRGFKYVLVIMDQFSKLTKLYPLKNQKLETIMDCLQVQYFHEIGIPNEILSDNGGQFITNRWREFANEMGFSIRKTSPYNPQSNPVERVRELGCIIRVYSHDRQTRWDKSIKRIEDTMNCTTHRSTGCRPVDLHEKIPEPLTIDNRLKSKKEKEDNSEDRNEEEQLRRRIAGATEILEKRAKQRKKQADKHEEATVYQPGTKVWIKLHRQSDANRRLTRKIHLVYDGPYVIQKEIRKNAYLIGDTEGNVLGAYNSRQIKPHREAELNPEAHINMMTPKRKIKNIPRRNITENIQLNKDAKQTDIEEPIAHSTPPKNNVQTLEELNVSGESQEKSRKRQKSQTISEKGMRHVSRLIDLITGRKKLPFMRGNVEGQQMKIILDTRGEFSIISKAAVKDIELQRTTKLERINDSKSIPMYLRRERKKFFHVVRVQISLMGHTQSIEAMILKADESCVLIGRLTRREIEKCIKSSIMAHYDLTNGSKHTYPSEGQPQQKQATSNRDPRLDRTRGSQKQSGEEKPTCIQVSEKEKVNQISKPETENTEKSSKINAECENNIVTDNLAFRNSSELETHTENYIKKIRTSRKFKRRKVSSKICRKKYRYREK